MRRVRADVSHRIRRQPSIFSTRWFRGLLGAGGVVVLALLVWPSIAGWFGSEMPRSLVPLLPWSGSRPAPDGLVAGRAGDPAGAVAATPNRTVVSGAGAGTVGAATRAPREPRAAARSGADPGAEAAARLRGASPPVEAGGAPGTALATDPPASRDPAGPRPPSLAAPSSVYWVQVGAFADPKNAERLVERLRADGLRAGTTTFEQSRIAYRVLLGGTEGTVSAEQVAERARALGHTVESTPEGLALAGLLPLRRAVETSQALRQQGLPVRLKQQVSSTTYRVVRVGSFATSADAEATLATLAGRGLEGIVVREH